MLLYAITDRAALGGDEAERADKLVQIAAAWSAGGVDFLQVREKDLPVGDLARLAARIVEAARQTGGATRVLVNAAPEIAAAVALQAQADGVHLRGGFGPEELAAAIADVRASWAVGGSSGTPPVISVSCHSVEEVRAARNSGASLALFAPVFEKTLPNAQALAGKGLESLAQACRAGSQPGPHPALPVIALGGVTVDNASECREAGADGVAGIRLFLGGRWAENRGGISSQI
jgi:thiamine-phosphate pyrophosphorylase